MRPVLGLQMAAAYTYSASWLTSASAGSTTYSVTAFDGLGRVTAATQNTSGRAYNFSYLVSAGVSGYNLIDEITSMTMPSGRKVTLTYDSIGRPNGLSAVYGSANPTYVSSVSYAPHGAVTQMALGNTLTEQTCFNNMLQPFVIRQRPAANVSACQSTATADTHDVGFFSYTFPSGNNGNVAGQTIQYGASGAYGSKSFQQTYTYDLGNRLASANENSAVLQSFGYDAVGNRWLSGGAQFDATTPTANVFTANNQFNSTNYDAKGNQTQDAGYTFVYDAESRLISSSIGGGNPASATYGYDAEGRLVTKTTGGVTTAYVYDVTGGLVAEYANGGSTECPSATCYLMTDHLGSTRMLTDTSGNQLTLFDYAPFGEELGSYDGRDARWAGFGSGVHFTGKEQEGYEGAYMYYFGARYFSAGLGRWTSPDRLNLTAARLINPSETLNKYVYAADNPLRFLDFDGEDITIFYRPPMYDTGHIFMTAVDQNTGKIASVDFGPDGPKAKLIMGSVPGFAVPARSPQDILDEGFASLTIQTSPDDAQKVIQWINKFQDHQGTFNLASANCTTSCVEALRILGIDVGYTRAPWTLWDKLFQKYSTSQALPTLGHYPAYPSHEYGNPRWPG